MNRVLVVEDEKLIRKGIVTMLSRVPVPIGEVIETRNGLEALEVLQNQKVDLVITDIRMPKMDGIQLVRAIQDVPDKPYVLVISGYDDFNYAVEVLRQGVKDYLLKPVEREKFYEVIQSVQQDIDGRDAKNEISKKIGSQQLKYLLLNKNIRKDEIDAIERLFHNIIPDNAYYICCCHNAADTIFSEEDLLILRDIGKQDLLILQKKQLDQMMNDGYRNKSMGISRLHHGMEELSAAYAEALKARQEAFAKCLPFYHFEEASYEYESVPEDFADQFVQLFGTQRAEEGIRKFDNIRFKARKNLIASDTLLEITKAILQNLIMTYERIIEFDVEELQKFNEPLNYENADQYFERLESWIRKKQQLIMEEFDDYRNKEKINMAVNYIKENFRSDLNMAVVSNSISMNYSLFSLNFKQYTGMNFVNYLKKIRIEEAKRLLEETEEKIIDISQMVGYENEKHFMKTFKSVSGVSPSEYRRNNQTIRKEIKD